MIKLCAWCNKKLQDDSFVEDNSDFQITHGMCDECKEYFFTNHSNTLDEFLNKLDEPVLLVNEDGDVLLANNTALQLLKKDITSIKNYRMGNVLECAWARLPEGCGHTVHCIACTLRQNINKTFATGESLQRVPAVLHRTNGKIHQTEFLISTEKVDNTVLLRIDEVIEQKNKLLEAHSH